MFKFKYIVGQFSLYCVSHFLFSCTNKTTLVKVTPVNAEDHGKQSYKKGIQSQRNVKSLLKSCSLIESPYLSKHRVFGYAIRLTVKCICKRQDHSKGPVCTIVHACRTSYSSDHHICFKVCELCTDEWFDYRIRFLCLSTHVLPSLCRLSVDFVTCNVNVL